MDMVKCRQVGQDRDGWRKATRGAIILGQRGDMKKKKKIVQ